MSKIKVKELILIAMFVALTAIGAFIKIPFPYVPITLQLLFCIYSGVLLGGRHGLYSQLVYIVIGLIGIPVFANGGGPTYILHPTFGYLIGFALCAYVVGKLTENLKRISILNLLYVNLCGLACVFLCGLIHLYIISNFYLQEPMSIKATLSVGLIPFLAKDMISIIVISMSLKHIIPILKKYGMWSAGNNE